MRYETERRYLKRAALEQTTSWRICVSEGPRDIEAILKSFKSMVPGNNPSTIFMTVGHELMSLAVLTLNVAKYDKKTLSMICLNIDDGSIVCLNSYDVRNGAGCGYMSSGNMPYLDTV